jgi:hypothetical protein
MTMPTWVKLSTRLPPEEVPVPLWGDKLTVGVDFPVTGRLCSHCGKVLAYPPDDDEDREYVLGAVTHWLDWMPGPTEEEE